MTAERTPENLALWGRQGAYASWANTASRTARTAPARQAVEERLRRQIDPDGVLPEPELEKRVKAALRARMLSLATKSAASRRANARGRRTG